VRLVLRRIDDEVLGEVPVIWIIRGTLAVLGSICFTTHTLWNGRIVEIRP